MSARGVPANPSANGGSGVTSAILAKQGNNLIDEHTRAIPSETELLQMLTVAQAAELKDDTPVGAIMKNTLRHINVAANILAWDPLNDAKIPLPKGVSSEQARQMQRKFGNDMNAAQNLAEVLKGQADLMESQALLENAAASTLVGKPGGSYLQKSTRGKSLFQQVPAAPGEPGV